MSAGAVPDDITGWLRQWQDGDSQARDRVFASLYQELKRLARAALRHNDSHATLQPTALLHDALIKLIDARTPGVADRSHFLSVVARAMRQALIDRARARMADKRGAGQRPLPLAMAVEIAGDAPQRLIELDALLATLTALDAEAAQVVELRVFAGLTIAETALALGRHPSAINREWAHACSWLREQLDG